MSEAGGRPGTSYPESYWRSLRFFSIYRLIVAGLLLAAFFYFRGDISFGSLVPRLYRRVGMGYVAFAAFFVAMAYLRRPGFTLQLVTQVSGDALFLVVLAYASGGVESGIAMLLLASLAGAGLISRGRLTLFLASVASICVLLEHTYEVLSRDAPVFQFVQAGLLSIGFFAVAWLAHTLARYARASEQLAEKRGLEVVNLAQINQLIIQDMQDGILVVDGAGRLMSINQQAQRLLGGAPESERLPLADYVPLLAARHAAWRANRRVDFDLLRVPATNRLVRTRFLAVGEDAQAGAVIFLEDMSRVQAQAQQLKLAALGRLTANIAHEIRNPLSAISHAAELMGEDPGDSAPRLLRIIGDNTRRLERMVRDVLELNRRDRANPEPLRVPPLLEHFIREFCEVEKIAPRSVSLETGGGADLTILFDRGHANQVLWNLVRNAWRHCRRADGSVALRAAPGASENTVVIDIMDDGPGVDPAQRSQVFEPFFTTFSGGTGLGLYIAREICDANGASLELMESASGAHFRIVCRAGHVKTQRASDAIRHW